MPRPFSSPAIALGLVAPPERMSSTTDARSRACRSALRAMAARSGAPPLPARLRASAPLGLPSFTPRLLATLSASLVRREIASRSCCAVKRRAEAKAPLANERTISGRGGRALKIATT